MLKQKSFNHQKINSVTLVIIPVAFILCAILVAFIVYNIKTSVANTSAVLNDSGVPLSWSNSVEPAKDLVAGVSAEMVSYDDYFVQYNPYLKNSGHDGHYLTHIASYLDTTSGDGHGFIPLSESTIEYTYTPDDSGSWTHLAVSGPSNTLDGFKLSTPLYLGPDGTPMSTIYFRYGVSADTSHSDHLTDAVSFLVMDESKTTKSLSVTKTALAYEASDSSDDPIIAAVDPSNDSEGTATKPLGAVSYVSNTDIIASVHTADTDSSDSPTIISSQALMIILISVFCSAILLYIPLRRL